VGASPPIQAIGSYLSCEAIKGITPNATTPRPSWKSLTRMERGRKYVKVERAVREIIRLRDDDGEWLR
jgi:hypothetical protein